MAGYQTVLEVRRLEEELDKLGLMMANPKHGWGNESEEYVSVQPKDADSLPIYARDVQLFTGSLRDLRAWMAGVTWARGYDMMLKLSDEKKRNGKEQVYRNRKLMKMLETGEQDA
jgi:hypothetical protein